MDFTSKIKNFLATASNTAGNYFKKTVQPEVQQLPQQVSSFGKTLLGDMGNFINTAPAAVGMAGSKYVIQPAMQNVAEGAKAAARQYAYSNPIVNMNPTLRKQYGYDSGYTPMQSLKDTGTFLKGVGSVIDPVGNVIGGTVGTGINAVSNLVQNKPILQNADKAYRQGFDFSATLSPIGAAVGALPLNRIAPAVERFVPKVGQLAGRLAEGATKEFVKGAGYGAVTGENPITTGLGFAPFGALEAFRPGGVRVKGANDNIIGIHPEDMKSVSDVYKRMKSDYRFIGEDGYPKFDNSQMVQDKKYIDELYKQHIFSGKGVDEIPFEDKVKQLFDQAAYNFRNRTPAFGLVENNLRKTVPKGSQIENGFIDHVGNLKQIDGTHHEAAYELVKGGKGGDVYEGALSELMQRGNIRSIIKPKEANFEIIGDLYDTQLRKMASLSEGKTINIDITNTDGKILESKTFSDPKELVNYLSPRTISIIPRLRKVVPKGSYTNDPSIDNPLLKFNKPNQQPLSTDTQVPVQPEIPQPAANLNTSLQPSTALQGEMPLQQKLPSEQLMQGSQQKLMPPLRVRTSQEPSVPQNAGEYVGYLKDKFNRFYTQAIDRFHPISQLGKQADEETAVRNALTGYYGTGSIGNYHVNYELAPILKQQSRDDLTKLAIAQRDLELSGRGIQGSNTGFNAEQLKQEWGQQKFDQVQGTLDKLYQYQDGLVKKYMVDTGIMSQSSYDAMKSQNQKYIPFKRVMDTVDEYLGVPQKKGAGSVSSQNVIKGIEGSKRQIIDPLQSVVENTYKLVGLGKRQEVAKTIVNLKDKLPEGMIQKISGEVGNKPSISVFENGKVQRYQVPPEVSEAAKGLTEEGMNVLVKILQAPTKVFRATATGYNPEFMAPNVVRDLQSAFVNVGLNPFKFVSGFAHLLKKDEVYQEFLKSGGQVSRISLDQPTLEKTVSEIYNPTGISIKSPSDILKILQKAGEYSEQPTRIAMFEDSLKKGLKKGLSPEEAKAAAANSAQEGTVNFARRGSKTAAVNAIYAFLNARAQGVDRLVRSVKNDPVGTSTRIGLISLAPALASYAWNRNFQSYHDPRVLSDTDKQNNFVIMLSDTPIQSLGGAQYIKIPKGDVGKLANPMEAFLSYADGKGGDIQKALMSSLKAFSPVDNIGDTIPTALRPPVENAANYNFFAGQQIVPDYKKDYPKPYQYSSYTSPIYRMIGKETNQSPAKLQNLIEGYGTGIAKIGAGALNTIVPEQYKSKQNEQGQDINRTPVLRRFLGGEKRTTEEQALIDQKKITGNMFKVRDIESGIKRGDIPVDVGINEIKKIQTQQEQPQNKIQAMGIFGGDSLTKDQTLKPKEQTPYEVKLNDSIAKIQLLNSDKPYLEQNGKVYIKTENDTAKVIDPNKTIEPPKLTGVSDVDKELIKDYKSSITSQVSDIVELYKIGKLTAEEASKKIQALHGQSGTYNKPKKPKLSGFKVTMPKVSKGFRFTVKQQKVKVPKLPELKSNLKALSFKGKPLKLKKL